jgi:CDP-glucose 4,6-dehydratase
MSAPPARMPALRDAAFWRDRPVLVTGATGLLGSWLCESLLARGADVVALVRDVVPESRFFTGAGGGACTTVFGDLRDGRLVERVLAEYEIDAVFHLGAQTIVEHALRDPANTMRSNVEGTWEVLDACRRSGRPARIVVASSDKAYGSQPELPYQEHHPLQGRHPYDVSKSCTDLIATAYHHTYGLPVTIARCGNVFGGGDLNWSRIVPGTIRSLLRRERPVLRSDGTMVRDYFYVEDAVSAYLALAEQIGRPGVAGEGFNFSNEQPVTVNRIVDTIREVMGIHDLPTVVLNTAKAEIKAQALSSGKARSVLGWSPEHDLAGGLRKTVDWHRAYLEDARS